MVIGWVAGTAISDMQDGIDGAFLLHQEHNHQGPRLMRNFFAVGHPYRCSFHQQFQLTSPDVLVFEFCSAIGCHVGNQQPKLCIDWPTFTPNYLCLIFNAVILIEADL
jgi:hypothetical protein